jgi:hypothetical protein
MAKSRFGDAKQAALPSDVAAHVVLPVPDDSGGDLQIHEPEGNSRDQMASDLLNHKLPLPDADRDEIQRVFQQRRRRQFSILEIMALVTLVALILSIVTWLPLNVFTGATGVATCIALILALTVWPKSRLVNVVWMTLLVLYLCAVIAALVMPS